MTLRHGVELYAAVLCPRHLQQRDGMLIDDERVGVVVHHHDVVTAREVHQSLVGLHQRRSSCRHVRVVGPHEFHPREVHCLQLLEVRLPLLVLAQVVVHHLSTENLAQRGVCGISRVRHQHLVAGVYEGESGVQYALLGAYERLNLRCGVESDAVETLVEARHGLSQLGCSHRGLVAVCRRLLRHLAQAVDGLLRRRHVGAAYGEAYDVLALGVHLRHLLQFTAEIVFLHQRQAFCWLDVNVLHILQVFSFLLLMVLWRRCSGDSV